MMRPICFLLFVIFISSSNSEAAQCKDGWTAFKDELCVKSFLKLVSYDDARDYCKQNNSTLVMAKESGVQLFLANFTSENHNNLWLASRYNDVVDDFVWEDGTRVNYSNWHGGYSGNRSRSGTCVELMADHNVGNTGNQWDYASCQKRNLVMCQRPLKWTLEETISEVKKMRKQLEDVAGDRDNLKLELKSTQEQLEAVSARVVPVGSIYIEYYKQPSPRTLWPSLQWQDVSSTYAGLFFRASGGGAASWGSTQTECAPHITEVQYHERVNFVSYPKTLSLSRNGWSGILHAGFNKGNVGNFHAEGLKFNTVLCEVHPKNQAVRMWKRTS